MVTDEFLQLHSLFEDQHPDEAQYAADLDGHRRLVHLRTHDTLDDYRPLREFPCPGALRVTDRTRTHRVVECDRCGWISTVRLTRETAAF